MAADEAGIMKDEVAGRLAERMALERREEVRDALGGSAAVWAQEAVLWAAVVPDRGGVEQSGDARSEEHTSELQSLMRISYAVFCLQKKKQNSTKYKTRRHTQQREIVT